MTLDTWTGGSIEMQQQDQCNLGLGAKMTRLLCPLSGHTDLFGRCRLEIGFHFLPFFECTHCSGSCHSECREPGKADTRLANGPRVDNCQLFLHFIGIYLKASKVPPKETKPKLANCTSSVFVVIYISPHQNRHIHIVRKSRQ